PNACPQINLYYGYPGRWLDNTSGVNVLSMGKGLRTLTPPPSEFRYTEQDYYVVNRASVLQDYWRFPYRVQPEFVLEFRGYAQAWVFRGDRLRAAGFQFEL
ncbi:MAG: hypothetical protein ACRDJN_21530, partial [Chloroflexota bacterium]